MTETLESQPEPSMADMLAALSENGLGYKLDYVQRLARDVQRALRLGYAPNIGLEDIPATLSEIERVYGKNKANFCPIKPQHGDTSIRLIRLLRGVVKRYHAQDFGPRKADDWTHLIKLFRDHITSGALEKHIDSTISLETLARLARLDGRKPTTIDNDWIQHLHAITDHEGQRRAIRAAADLLEMAKNLPDLFPAELLYSGNRKPFPRREKTVPRQPKIPPKLAKSMAGFKNARSANQKKGFQQRESGRTTSEAALAEDRRGAHWYICALRELDILLEDDDPTADDIACDEMIFAAVEAEINGEFSWKPLEASTLRNRIYAVLRWLRRYNPALKGLMEKIRQQNDFFDGLEAMSEARQDWCSNFITNPTWQVEFFNMPVTFQRAAQEKLRRYETLNVNERAEAMDYAIAAVMAAILTSLPLRIGNLLHLRIDGCGPHVQVNQEGLLHIHLPEKWVKNRTPIDQAITTKPPIDPAEILRWWLDGPRKLLLARHIDNPDPTALFCGLNYARLSRAWTRTSSQIGLAMTPHLVRHAIATFLVHRNPDKIRLVQALLRVSEQTMLRNYVSSYTNGLAQRADALLADQLAHLRQDQTDE